MKINEQIAALRKQKGCTQEELAVASGVTNQAVSKWEAAKCCRDIQLLPALADFFEISIDELMGHITAKNFVNKGDPDSLFEAAVEVLAETGFVSTSLLQYRLQIGYGMARRIIDRMNEKGCQKD